MAVRLNLSYWQAFAATVLPVINTTCYQQTGRYVPAGQYLTNTAREMYRDPARYIYLQPRVYSTPVGPFPVNSSVANVSYTLAPHLGIT